MVARDGEEVRDDEQAEEEEKQGNGTATEERSRAKFIFSRRGCSSITTLSCCYFFADREAATQKTNNLETTFPTQFLIEMRLWGGRCGRGVERWRERAPWSRSVSFN